MESLGKGFFWGHILLQGHPGENYYMDLVGLGCLPFLLEAQAPCYTLLVSGSQSRREWERV